MQDFNQKSARQNHDKLAMAIDNLISLYAKKFNPLRSKTAALDLMGYRGAISMTRGEDTDETGKVTIFGLNYSDCRMKRDINNSDKVQYFFMSQLLCCGFDTYPMFIDKQGSEEQQVKIWTKETPETIANYLNERAEKFAKENKLGKYRFNLKHHKNSPKL